MNVGAGAAVDNAGNGNYSSQQLSRHYDGTAPPLEITSSASGPTDISPLPMTIAFIEPVSDFALSEIVLDNGLSTSLVIGDNIVFTKRPLKLTRVI